MLVMEGPNTLTREYTYYVIVSLTKIIFSYFTSCKKRRITNLLSIIPSHFFFCFAIFRLIIQNVIENFLK